MGLLKKKECAICGREAKIMTRTALADGNYLCSDCGFCIPKYMETSVKNSYTIDDFNGFKNYLNTESKVLKEKFRETKSYYTLHIDAVNKIMYIGKRITEDTLFLKFSDIEEFELTFSADEFKEGILGDKVTGKVLFLIKYAYPSFYHEEVLDYAVKTSAKKSFFGSKVSYSNPPEMDEFLEFFYKAWGKALDAEQKRLEEELYNEYKSAWSEPDELQQALSLFMFDSIEEVTLEFLRAQRNRLMKTYHPDTGSETDNKFAQKINAAYEIIKSNIR